MSLSDPHQYMSFQKGETEPENSQRGTEEKKNLVANLNKHLLNNIIKI